MMVTVQRCCWVLVVLAAAACKSSDGQHFQVGGPDASPHVYQDARVYQDVRPLDASLPPDAFVPHDAPPPPARVCTNKGDSITNGQETLKLAITCSIPSDQGRVTHATITGGSGSNATTFDFQFALDCANTVGVPVNNFLMFAASQDLHAMGISASLFDVPCN
jgi:hypothetical protein